jgi:predicted nucleic acid-binding protein
LRATVFDSYALLALFFREPGAEQVTGLLHEAAVADRPILITTVNWAEVLYRVARKQGDAGVADAKRFERTMPLDVVPADMPLAELAAEYKAAHKMSLADAFAAALAKQKKAELVTGDPEFKAVQREIKIGWLK